MIGDNNTVSQEEANSSLVWKSIANWLRDRTNRFNEFVAKAKADKLQNNLTDNELAKQNLYMSSLNTDDHNVANECTRLIRLKNVADWLNDYFYWWQKVINEWEEMAFVQDWLNDNEDNIYGQTAYNYIADDSITDCDAMPFYEKMWWIRDESNIDSNPSSMDNGMWMADNETPTEEWERDKKDIVLHDRWGNEYKAKYTDDEGTVAWDILGGIMEFVQWFWWWMERQMDKWLNKAWLMSDEQYDLYRKVNAVTQFEDMAPWVNENDFTYEATNFITELAYMWQIWWMEASVAEAAITKYPKLAKIIGNIALKSKWATRIRNLLQRWIRWWTDMLLLDSMDWEDWSLTDFWWGSIFNILLWGIFWKKTADKMIDKSFMNQSWFKELMKMLKDKWVDIEPEAVWEFINKRFKGSKEQIKKQAETWAKDSEKILDSLLETSTDKFESKTATDILTAIAEDLESKISKEWAGVEDKLYSDMAAEIRALINWDNKYTLSELKNVIRKLTDSDMNPFTKKFAEVKWKEIAWKFADMYRNVKSQIEKLWEELWLWDIKNLNREIYTSYEIAKWVGEKDLAEQISSRLSPAITAIGWWWVLWGIIWYINWDTTKWTLIGSLAWFWGKYFKQLFKSSTFKSYVSDLIYKFSWEYKQSLLDWLGKEWEAALSESANKELENILQKHTDKKFWNKVYTDLSSIWWRVLKWEWIQEVSED